MKTGLLLTLAVALPIYTQGTQEGRSGLLAGFTPPQTPKGIYYGTANFPGSQFAKEPLARYCREMLMRQQNAVIDLWLYRNNQEANAAISVTSVHVSYSMWKSSYDDLARKDWPVAHFVAIRGAGLLSIRGEDGSVEQVSVGRDDTTGLLSADSRSQILYPYAVVQRFRPPRDVLILFVKTKEPLTEDLGLTLLGQVGDLPFDVVSLVVRSDSWFISEFEFPLFYPFGRSGGPPTHQDYWNSPTLKCSKGKTVDCVVYGHSGDPP